MSAVPAAVLETMHRRKDCRLCGSPDVELVLSLDPVPLQERYCETAEAASKVELFPLDIFLCLNCGHVQQMDVIDLEYLWAGYTYRSAQSKGLVEHFEQVAANVLRKHDIPKNGFIVDIGSNDGSLLKPFKRLGHKVLGIDPATEIAKAATSEGIETIPELLSMELAEDIRSKHGPADVIFAFNSFAHCDDLDGMVEAIKAMMNEHSLFIFEAQYLLDVVEKTLVATIFHEHMSHHSVRPLARFFRKHGLMLRDVERVPVQHGAIIGTVQMMVPHRSIQESVYDLIALESARQLDRRKTFQAFTNRISATREKVAALITRWRSKGVHVAGYGAAHSGPTLLSAMGLTTEIEFLVDDHALKVGKFAPGGIPVLPTSELCKRMPQYCVILAWVHAQRIIDSNQDYLRNGGKFVVLCPEFRVVEA